MNDSVVNRNENILPRLSIDTVTPKATAPVTISNWVISLFADRYCAVHVPPCFVGHNAFDPHTDDIFIRLHDHEKLYDMRYRRNRQI